MMGRNRHKNKNNPKPINAKSYSPTSLGGRIDADILYSLFNQKQTTNGTNDKKSLQTKGEKKRG